MKKLRKKYKTINRDIGKKVIIVMKQVIYKKRTCLLSLSFMQGEEAGINILIIYLIKKNIHIMKSYITSRNIVVVGRDSCKVMMILIQMINLFIIWEEAANNFRMIDFNNLNQIQCIFIVKDRTILNKITIIGGNKCHNILCIILTQCNTKWIHISIIKRNQLIMDKDIILIQGHTIWIRLSLTKMNQLIMN